MKKVLGVFVFFVILLMTISAAYAEEKEKEIRLEEIVVTATRTEKEAASAPGSVTVVTKKDMEKKNIKAVDEALNAIPGVFNWREKGIMDTLAHISLRGIPKENRTLILLDGMPLNDAYTGGVMWQGLATEDVERIEVVKGPFSSLYGGCAMGGVVNVITRMPEKREFTLKTGYGSSWDRSEGLDDLRKFYVSYGDRIEDKLSVLLSYGYKSTNGYPSDFNVQATQPPAGITGWSYTTDNQGGRRYLIGDKGDNRWWDDGITVKGEYDISQATKVNFSFMRTRYEYNYDEPHTFLRDTAGNEVWSYGTVKESSFLSGNGSKEKNTYLVTYETEISPVKAKLSLGLVDQEAYWYTSPGSTATRFGGPGKVAETPAESYHAELQFTVPVFKRHLLNFGGSFRYGWADTNERNLTNWKDEDSKTDLTYQAKGKEKTYALFVQDEIMILENLTAYLGFRQDWWETYDGYSNQIGMSGYPKNYDSRDKSSFSPKAAIVYKPFEKTALRTSVGKAFRPPTIYELYRTWTSSSTGKTYAGSPDLKPEKTLSWDVGLEQGLWRGAKVKATYFENYLDDLIYLVSTPTPNLYEYKNVAKAESRGVELEGEQRFEKWLRFFANFTYNRAKVEENPAKPETEGKRLTYVPERMFNFGVDLEKGPFSINLTGRYVDKIYGDDENKDRVSNVYGSYDSYFVVDTKVSYKVTKFATLSLSVDNVFDEDYFYYYKAPGRSWFCELTMRF